MSAYEEEEDKEEIDKLRLCMVVSCLAMWTMTEVGRLRPRFGNWMDMLMTVEADRQPDAQAAELVTTGWHEAV